MKPLVAKKWVQICVLAALFIAAAGTALFIIRKPGSDETAATSNRRGPLDEIPGLSGGDVVKLPKLPTLKNDYVDLGAVEQKYLLFAFISTDCEGCSQDERFWRDLLTETSDKNVQFYVISIDADQARIQTFAKTYQFEDLPVLFDPRKEALAGFKIQFVPQYVLLTRGGMVITRWNGIRRYDPKHQNATEKLDGLRELISASASVH